MAGFKTADVYAGSGAIGICPSAAYSSLVVAAAPGFRERGEALRIGWMESASACAAGDVLGTAPMLSMGFST